MALDNVHVVFDIQVISLCALTGHAQVFGLFCNKATLGTGEWFPWYVFDTFPSHVTLTETHLHHVTLK